MDAWVAATWFLAASASRIGAALLTGLWHASIGASCLAVCVWAVCRLLPIMQSLQFNRFELIPLIDPLPGFECECVCDSPR